MPDIEPFSPRGMFHEGWTAEVSDYAIACGWALKGKQFIVGDVAGGIFAFEGDTGKIIFLHSKEILEKLFGKKKILTLVVY